MKFSGYTGRMRAMLAEKKEGCLARLRGILPSLHSAERKVADYVLNHAETLLSQAVNEVATGAGASEAGGGSSGSGSLAHSAVGSRHMAANNAQGLRNESSMIAAPFSDRQGRD